MRKAEATLRRMAMMLSRVSVIAIAMPVTIVIQGEADESPRSSSRVLHTSCEMSVMASASASTAALTMQTMTV